MFRQSITKPLTTANRAVFNRSFSALAPRMAEGDTGAPKSGVSPRSDSWQRREAAEESRYIYEKEMERLKELKAHIAQQKDMLQELDKKIDELSGGQGGHK